VSCLGVRRGGIPRKQGLYLDKTHGEKRQESVPSDLCKSGSNEQDTEWLAYSSAPNICHTE
jgi:hypothetical protein